jgi:hypothetical protein
MACVLPFRPWSSPALRVFGRRTPRGWSTSPTFVLSCPYAPPQWLTPELVATPERLGRPCLPREAPRSVPWPFSMSRQKNPSFRPARAGRLEGVAVPSKSPALRVWLPSRRRKPFCPRKPLSASHAPGLRPSEPFSDPAARPRFPEGAPLVRFPAKPVSLAAALQRLALARPAVHPAPGLSCWAEWSLCSPGLPRLPGFHPPGFGESVFLPPAPRALSFPTSEDVGNRGPRGSIPAARLFPSFEGRWPA